MNPGASGGGGGQRTALALPAAVTRGPGAIACPQTTPREVTPLLRVNGLPGEGQIWLLSVQGQSPSVIGPRGPFVSDGIFSDHAEIQWQVGNTMQRIEADVPAGGLCVPLLCEAISVDYVRENDGVLPRPAQSFAASISAALGSPRAARLTRTIEALVPALGQNHRVPPKATEVQFSPGSFAVPATATFSITFLDSQGAVVGVTGFQNSQGSIRYVLPRAAVQWTPTLLAGVATTVTAVFEINP